MPPKQFLFAFQLLGKLTMNAFLAKGFAGL